MAHALSASLGEAIQVACAKNVMGATIFAIIAFPVLAYHAYYQMGSLVGVVQVCIINQITV
jgi:hypothetical protein